MLKFILLPTFLIMASCGIKPEIPPSNSTWGIETPVLVSVSRGSQFSFRELELRRLDRLNSSDIVKFTLRPNESVKLEVESICTKDSSRAQLNLSFKLPQQLSISEILPADTRLDDGWQCSFKFLASSGTSEHYFELDQYLIDDDIENTIQVAAMVFDDELSDSIIETPQPGIFNLHCSNDNWIYKTQTKSFYFSDFKIQFGAEEKRNHLCRILLREKDGRTAHISKLFWRISFNPQATIDETQKFRWTYDFLRPNLAILAYSWTIRNQSSFDYLLQVPKHKATISATVAELAYGQNVGTTRDFPAQMSVNLESAGVSENFKSYLLPKFSYATVSFTVVSSVDCNNFDHGFYLEPLPTELATLKLGLRPEQELKKYTLKEIHLSLPEEHWVGRRYPKVRFPGGMTGQTGPNDQYGALPANIVQLKSYNCR